jgi:RND superfamily putative drug exporter
MQRQLSFTVRIAGFSFRHKWYVLGAWLLLLVGAGIAASGLGRVLTTQGTDLSGSDSAHAKDLIERRFGEQPRVELLVVRSETDTVESPTYQVFVNGLADRLRATPGVAAVTTWANSGDPHAVSADRHATITSVTLAGDRDEAERHARDVLDAVATFPQPEGYRAEITGTATLNHTFNTIAEEDLARAETFGLPVALIVMVLAFGTVVAAGVPLVLAIAAIGPSLGTVALIGQAFELSFFVTNIITMIGLAVGIDYSLFIIGRYREELGRGRAPLQAMEVAADSSGRAVFFSGLTVLLALAGMLLVRNNIFISIGIGAMVVVLYAVIASLTLLPAVLAILGRKVNALRVPFLGRAGYGQRFWALVTRAVQRRPAVFAAATAALLIAAALPLTTIDLGASGPESLPRETSAYRALQTLQRDFPGGLTDPLQIVVDGPIADPSVQAAIARLEGAINARGDLQWVGVRTDADGHTALIQVATREIGTGETAQRIIDQLRQGVVPAAFGGTGARVYVGGDSLPTFVDMKAEMDAKLPVVFVFVLGLSFILLLLVFRSVAIPAKAILMNLLSVGAAYGLIVAVFQHGFLADVFGFQTSPQIEFWLPLFLFSILFGLSMDYHVFLLSRVKEEWDRTGANKPAVARGVTATAGMITSAAAIMVAVFAAFASGRLVGLQQMGFGLAVAVFLDATVVRSVLVPASMQLLGKYNWWMPNWLGWLPRLTIEGAAHPEAVPVPVESDLYAAGD